MNPLSKMTNMLIESAEYRDETTRQARIFEKWNRTSLLRKLDATAAKHVSTLLENQALALKEMSNLHENTNTSDIATFNKIAFPLVRRVYGGLISKDLVSVQPMSAPQTLVFYIDYSYVNSAGVRTGHPYGKRESDALESADFNRNTSKTTGTLATTFATATTLTMDTDNGQDYLSISADTVDQFPSNLEWGNTIKFVSNSVTGWGHVTWAYDNEHTGATTATPFGAADGYMGTFHADRFYIDRAISADGLEFTGDTLAAQLSEQAVTFTYTSRALNNVTEGNSDIQRLSFEMKSKPVEAQTRKLMVQWSTEVEQDAKAYHGLDVEKTLTDFLSEHIMLEIDREIINDLFEGYDTRNEESWDMDSSASTLGMYATFEEHHRGLLRQMNKVSHQIFARTKRGPASFALVSPEVAAVLESLPGMAVDNDGSGTIGGVGVTKLGTLNRKWNVFVDPLLSSTINYNKVLMGYKGNNVYDAGYIYAPYIVGVMSPVIFDPDELFTPRRGILSRYGKTWIRRDFYGAVVVENLDSFGSTLMQNK
jgi:hypothetical protein